MNWLASIRPAVEWLNRLPQQRLNLWLSGAFVVLFCWLLAKLSWQLLPAPQAEPIHAEVSVSAAGAPDLRSLLAADLFGKAAQVNQEAAPVAVPSSAPKTTLNVKLTGVVAVAGKPEQGSAVIESQGAEQTYGVDDRIEGTSATLSQVFDDRVLLRVSSRFETLMLDGIEYQQMAAENSGLQEVSYQPQAEPMMSAPQPPVEELADMRKEMLSEPMKFFDYIRASPQYRNGQLYGYRIMPGKDPALFERMGLKANDVAVEINGTALNDLQQAMLVMNELREATQASIKVERDGQTRDIVFSLSQ